MTENSSESGNNSTGNCSGSGSSAETGQKQESVRNAFSDLGEAAKNAARAGAAEAREFASDTIPKLKKFLLQGTRDVTFGFAWLTAFGVTAIREMTPGPMAEGARKGTAAGRSAAEKFFEKQREAAATDDVQANPENGMA